MGGPPPRVADGVRPVWRALVRAHAQGWWLCGGFRAERARGDDGGGGANARRRPAGAWPVTAAGRDARSSLARRRRRRRRRDHFRAWAGELPPQLDTYAGLCVTGRRARRPQQAEPRCCSPRGRAGEHAGGAAERRAASHPSQPPRCIRRVAAVDRAAVRLPAGERQSRCPPPLPRAHSPVRPAPRSLLYALQPSALTRGAPARLPALPRRRR